MLRELYSGKIIPFERRDRPDGECRELVSRIDNEERYFMDKLPEEDYERFKALSNLYAELAISEENEIFAYGFSMGALIMLDVTEESRFMAAKPSER